ncbi:MAG TPA: D-glycero-beta-D-manno-heptose 1-phosphate adenylyltransferase [Candidatus Goldiibacteriota bacterium]|nr:D-glycero-beta-D-manno-heptose 1-phosphate adenylyltransferase [Candidatus Goldiibacteriota bacterium]
MNRIILDRKKLISKVNSLKKAGKKIVFTNGCYDLLHVGHIRFLKAAKKLGDVLVLALNSDASVRRIKGPSRPVVPENERAELMSELECVDLVTLFHEDDPYNIISNLVPDVLVKGGDWALDKIIGADIVLENGGKVRNIRYLKGKSTTNVIRKVLESYG